MIEGQDQLKNHTSQNIIKVCLGHWNKETSRLMSPGRMIAQVSDEENAFLIAPFTEEEVRKAVFQMEHNKAPGPDGFPAEFYQNFWEIIKSDLMEMFAALQAGQLDLF